MVNGECVFSWSVFEGHNREICQKEDMFTNVSQNQMKVKQRFAKISQSQAARAPGPSPGLKRLLKCFHF